ncbi:MAG: hypothetical protein IKS24_09210 [Bacteroidaceae bacterium]|nr:hypothetical protein [Bacteroidaceae bacterium]
MFGNAFVRCPVEISGCQDKAVAYYRLVVLVVKLGFEDGIPRFPAWFLWFTDGTEKGVGLCGTGFHKLLYPGQLTAGGVPAGCEEGYSQD